jgi:hypothetical protein
VILEIENLEEKKIQAGKNQTKRNQISLLKALKNSERINFANGKLIRENSESSNTSGEENEFSDKSEDESSSGDSMDQNHLTRKNI